jgi:3-oxoacyl-[acyl-carrier protein] reductase
MNLKNKVIAITGGAQGLGRAMALSLADKGANLALIDMNEEKLKESVALCEAKGVKAKYYVANISSEDVVNNLFKQIASDMGGLDGLVNNAGILRDGLMIKHKEGQLQGKLTLSEWQAVIDVNLTGVFLCAREAAIVMADNKTQGAIVNISSISRAGNMGQSNYSAAKAGVAAMTVTWAKELARFGIRVGAVAPGFIATEMTASMKPEALEKICALIPLKRMGKPEEIAHAVNFILENDYFSGRVVEVDGGLRI